MESDSKRRKEGERVGCVVDGNHGQQSSDSLCDIIPNISRHRHHVEQVIMFVFEELWAIEERIEQSTVRYHVENALINVFELEKDLCALKGSLAMYLIKSAPGMEGLWEE